MTAADAADAAPDTNRTITAKAWDPSLEDAIRKKWRDERTYEFSMKEAGQNYTIDTPPPYPSGRPWHIGAAAHYSQIDMIARAARMAGKNVYFPIGIDRNGLPVEIYTEKKHKIRMHDTDRKEFLELCSAALDELESEMVDIMEGLGLSGDVSKRYRTDTPEYRALTQATFIKMWQKGNIYLANRPNNYDWVSGTTIADAEIAYEEVQSRLVYMKFAIENPPDDGDGHVMVASTRPELLCACRAVIVNEDDERHAMHVGKTVTVPMTGARVTIRGHHSARPEFGSGAVMVCSYGDQSDVALFRELKLEEVAAIGLDGRMTDAAGPYAGLRPKQARARIIQDMQEEGVITKVEDIMHRTPVAERSRNPIEIIPMEEYYMRQTDHIDRVREMADKITFHPPMHKQVLFNWLESISMDWPISRRRYYSTEIPAWHCRRCGEVYIPEPGRYYRPWAEECPAESCGGCGASDFAGEERTFDTWMDSSISPLFISGYGRSDEAFARLYPTSIRPQAKDIVRTWMYYTLLRCDKMTGAAPWSEAWVMGYGLDEHGLKMSKSKGNAIDPLPVIQRLGADTFRFWNASEVNHGYDFRCGEKKIESSKKFLSKLWNVSRFLSSFEVPEGIAEKSAKEVPLQEADRWILAELDELVVRCRAGYDEYNFFIPAIAVREFTWNLFAAHYIEMAKGRAYGAGFSKAERQGAVYALHTVLRTVLKLLAPITPFITEYLWQKLYVQGDGRGKSIHKERHAEPRRGGGSGAAAAAGADDGDKSTYGNREEITQAITGFNSMVWNEKKARNLSLKSGIDFRIPDDLRPFEKDLRAMHNLGG